MGFDHRSRHAQTGGAAAAGDAVAPGKRTLTEQLPVQRLASRGIATPATPTVQHGVTEPAANATDETKRIHGILADVEKRNDAELLFTVIRRVLEEARATADDKTSTQLLDLVRGYGHAYPAVGNAIADAERALAHKRAQAPAVTASARTESSSGAATTTTTGGATTTAAHGKIVTPADRHEAPGSMKSRVPDLAARQAARRQSEWEVDKTYPNFRDEEWVDMPDAEIFQGITKIDTSVPLTLRRMMVGQALGEQSISKKPNRNFAGFELGAHGKAERPAKTSATIWTRNKRSDTITPEQYWAEPDKYYDNPYYGHSIAEQLDHPDKRPSPNELNVMWYSPRYAYDTAETALAVFHSNVTGKLKKVRTSPYSEHQELAAKIDTEPDAYLDALELNSAWDYRQYPKLIKAPEHDVKIQKMAFNGTNSYKKTVIASVRAALHNETLKP